MRSIRQSPDAPFIYMALFEVTEQMKCFSVIFGRVSKSILATVFCIMFSPYPILLWWLWEDAYVTLPYLTLPYLTLPYLTLIYLTLIYLTLPYFTLPYLILPYFTLPYLTLPYLTLSYLILSHLISSQLIYFISSWHILSYLIHNHHHDHHRQQQQYDDDDHHHHHFNHRPLFKVRSWNNGTYTLYVLLCSCG